MGKSILNNDNGFVVKNMSGGSGIEFHPSADLSFTGKVTLLRPLGSVVRSTADAALTIDPSTSVLVLAADVVEHIKNDKKTIKNFYNFLKKDGHVLITVPAFNFLFSNKDVALKHFRRYRKSNIKRLLIKNFQIKKLSYFNFFLFLPIALSILILKIKKTKFIKFAETTPTSWINAVFKNIFLIEKYLLRFLNFPFGISIIALAKKND